MDNTQSMKFLVGIHLVLVFLGKDFGHGEGEHEADNGDSHNVSDYIPDDSEVGESKWR